MSTFKVSRRRAGQLAFCAAVAVGSACKSPVDEPDSKVPAECQFEAPLIEPLKTDILFVVDNSNSMTEEQESVATELPAFIDELRKGAGVEQDFQVGLITTGIYQSSLVDGKESRETFENESGRLQAVPVPDPNNPGAFLPGTEKVLTDKDPLLVDKFRLLVKQGTAGSGQETPFEAVRLATDQNLANLPQELGGSLGFFRDGARLLVAVVTDEDDCSENVRPPKVVLGDDPARDYCGEQSANLAPVSYYHDAFRALKDRTGRTREVLWATIGPVSRSTKVAKAVLEGGVIRNEDCPTSFQPGFRHFQMAERFDPQLANLDSICNASYRESLIRIAAIANASQSIEVRNVPDPQLLQVSITRGDGQSVQCTLSNGGIGYEAPSAGQNGRVHFLPSCLRRADDAAVSVKLLCVG